MAAVIMCAPQNTSTQPYNRHLWDIEVNFDICKASTWHSNNWKLCFYFIASYLVAIFVGLKYMRSHQPFQLRGVLFFWNFALASFSTLVAWRMVTSMAYDVRTYGFLATVCYIDPIERRQSVGLWMILFPFSKIVEFGDTAFIVLRKTPLIFLHWYHHTTVAFLAWSTGAYASPMQAHFVTVNALVHAIMYSYYALKVLGIRIPKPIRITITSLQLVQMAYGVFVNSYAYRAKAVHHDCFVPDESIAIAAAIYFTYFLLFLNFFVRSYLFVGQKKSAIDTKVKKLT